MTRFFHTCLVVVLLLLAASAEQKTASLNFQVIAPGFRTYGQDYDINQPNLEITIKLEKPAGQVSIYK